MNKYIKFFSEQF